MALRTILTLPEDEDRLRAAARPVTEFDARLAELLEDMAETMHANDGCGLAGPQVGILRRVAVVDVGDEHGVTELVNPVIKKTKGSVVGIEGCLSIPGRHGYVARPYRIVVEAQDRYGRAVVHKAEGYRARAFCHEIDHLDGIVYTDKLEEAPEDGE